MRQMENLPLGRLLANVCRLHATRADQLMESIGLYRSQGILLVILAEQEGLTHSEIAEKLRISPAAATKVIKRLEQLSCLQRRADPHDERLSRVYLLPYGRAVIGQIHSAFSAINQMMVADFSSEEQDTLRTLLLRIQTNMRGIPEKVLPDPLGQVPDPQGSP